MVGRVGEARGCATAAKPEGKGITEEGLRGGGHGT